MSAPDLTQGAAFLEVLQRIADALELIAIRADEACDLIADEGGAA